MYVKNKRGDALIFFMELLLLLGFVFLIFFGATKIINHDGKYLSYDATNLALFLERIPSINSNFVYRYTFITPEHSNNIKLLDIEIRNDRVLLDVAGLGSKTYFHEYKNPENFQIDVKLDSVSEIYVYKINNKIEIKKSLDEKLIAEMQILVVEDVEFPDMFYFSSPLKTNFPDNIHPKIYTDLCTTKYSDKFLHIMKLDSQQKEDSIIYYTKDAKEIALNLYNDFVMTNTVSIYPINENSNIISTFECLENSMDNKIVIISYKSSEEEIKLFQKIYARYIDE